MTIFVELKTLNIHLKMKIEWIIILLIKLWKIQLIC